MTSLHYRFVCLTCVWRLTISASISLLDSLSSLISLLSCLMSSSLSNTAKRGTSLNYIDLIILKTFTNGWRLSPSLALNLVLRYSSPGNLAFFLLREALGQPERLKPNTLLHYYHHRCYKKTFTVLPCQVAPKWCEMYFSKFNSQLA